MSGRIVVVSAPKPEELMAGLDSGEKKTFTFKVADERPFSLYSSGEMEFAVMEGKKTREGWQFVLSSVKDGNPLVLYKKPHKDFTEDELGELVVQNQSK